MHADRYGLPVSTLSQLARDAYVAGADCILAGAADWKDSLERAIEADAGFALAHVTLARGLFLDGEMKQAREATARARELAQNASPRERSHVNAMALAMEGKAADALEATRTHLAEFPRDAMVLAPATGPFGLIGFSGRQQREQELDDLLRALASHYGEDWWFQSVLAFAACECGRLDEAGRLIERSMAANPHNAHGAHVMVHVFHEMGETAKCLDYLEGWMPDYDKRGLLHCHLSWHVALAAHALGKLDSAWDAYHSCVRPGGAWGPPLNVVTDAASFLWRTELAGEARHPDLWQEVRDYALKSFPRAGVPFADVHTAVACVASGDFAALDRLTGELHARLDTGKLAPGRVVPMLADGFAAYAINDWDASIRFFEEALPETVRIGGSRAQRELVEYTLLAACLKAGRAEKAHELVARCSARRSTIPVAGFGQP